MDVAAIGVDAEASIPINKCSRDFFRVSHGRSPDNPF
jgi:hypothetical protein